MVEILTLTDEQKTKLKGIKREFSPKLMKPAEKMMGVLTPEQKKAWV